MSERLAEAQGERSFCVSHNGLLSYGGSDFRTVPFLFQPSQDSSFIVSLAIAGAARRSRLKIPPKTLPCRHVALWGKCFISDLYDSF
jgi:hypothetical protein